MKIGIIGAGHVGGTLGVRWARNGHQVTLSSRDPQSAAMRELVAKAGSATRATTPQEAAISSDVLLLATPYSAARSAISSLGNVAEKILIDATNPLLSDLSGLTLGTTMSAAEEIAVWVRGAKVVKAFNTVGYNIMENTDFGAARPAMCYCGDDADANAQVASLIAELGFEPVNAGPLRQARLLEPFALLWISLAYGAGYGREIAFQLLRR